MYRHSNTTSAGYRRFQLISFLMLFINELKANNLGCIGGCPKFSVCRMLRPMQYVCQCREGFILHNNRCIPGDCNLYSNCDENAYCIYNERLHKYACKCRSGFTGDGMECRKRECLEHSECDANARCIPNSDKQYKLYCMCNPGFHGDGYRCVADQYSCNTNLDCHKNAHCSLNPLLLRYMCQCAEGYEGDGYNCTFKNSCSTGRSCAPNAICVYNEHFREQMCACKAGYIGDGTRCYTTADCESEKSLLFTQSRYLILLSLYNTYLPAKAAVIEGTALNIAYDCQSRSVIFTDPVTRSIKQCSPNGRRCITLLEDLPQPEAISVDWLSRLVFWTDTKRGIIEAATLDGQKRKTLVKHGVNKPRSITLNPQDGLIYWTDMDNRRPRIERANMDGTDRTLFVCDNLRRPTGIVYHSRSNEICWADSSLGRVECINANGYNRRVIYENSNAQLFSLAAGQLSIYASDWASMSILKISIFGNVSVEHIYPPRTSRVFGMSTVTNCPPELRNACDHNNGGCPDVFMCIPNRKTQMGRICTCPDNSNACLISGRM